MQDADRRMPPAPHAGKLFTAERHDPPSCSDTPQPSAQFMVYGQLAAVGSILDLPTSNSEAIHMIEHKDISQCWISHNKPETRPAD